MRREKKKQVNKLRETGTGNKYKLKSVLLGDGVS